jgi:serralysin
VPWTLDAEIENLVLAGTVAINGTGADNLLVGNAGNNTLGGNLEQLA